MSVNNSKGALAGVRAIADRVVASTDGLTIVCPDSASAIKLRQQFNSMRVQDRRDSCKINPSDHPGYNSSVYDSIETRIKDNTLVFTSTFATLKGFQIFDNSTNSLIPPEEL